MIKINLLGAAPPPKVPSAGAGPAPLVTQIVMLVGSLAVCFGIVGVIYVIWSNQIGDLEKARDRERIRQTDLAAVKAQNATYQQRLKDLETRINTIQALQNSRVGPVELMSVLGNVVNKTRDVFLYTMTPAGNLLAIKGQSNSVDSMATFLSSLKNSGSFPEVQLDQFYEDDQHDRLTYKFSVSCQFKSPTGGTVPPAGAAIAAGGAPNAPVGSPVPGLPADTKARAKVF
jgi:Tfp pilus assembly protein PilN